MGKVIQLTKEQTQPTISGEAECFICGHEWVAIAPVGTIFLTCPKCNLIKGIFKYPVEREGLHWECNCGNKLFRTTPDGFYCPACGQWQHGF